MREKLNALLEKHCVTIKSSVVTLGEHLTRAREDGAAPAEAVTDAIALAHQLKGSSGTAGFHDICGAATELYEHLKQIKGSEGAPMREGMAQAAALYETLHRVSQVASPQTSALYLAM